MEKQKVLLSFVEKAPKQRQPSEILALTADGKRLVRLQPEAKRQKCQLLGVLTEKNSGDEPSSRRRIRIASKSEITTLRQQLPEVNDENYGISSGKSEDEADAKKQKIPRPANAFMLFANEWRKKLAVENPRESNKDISVRLGVLWKTMSKEVKEKYFALAREVDAEHKRKYPARAASVHYYTSDETHLLVSCFDEKL